MKNFLSDIFTFLFILSIPGIFLLVLYCHYDPFRVVKKYDLWYENNPVPPNRDYVSTELYLSQKDIYNYDSFVFGSSRTISFYASSWKSYLEKSAVPFKFDAAGEGLYGIYTKLKFLDSQKIKIKNVLILFCRDGISITENFSGHLIIKHPKVSGEGWIKFHYSFLKSYFNLKFLVGYYYHLITGKQNSLTNGIIQMNKISLDRKTNQIKVDYLDSLLRKDSAKYYIDRKQIFYDKSGESFKKDHMIEKKQLIMLREIRDILKKNKINYKIILSPLYDEIKFSQSDKEILISLFGTQLYDFTGKNFITEEKTNWYETDHFRPFVADSILKLIYEN